jgi:hypothetical protein
MAALLASARVNAGDQRPCTDPVVFQDAAVNSFVLPYRYVGNNPTPELERASRQISALVHFEVLFGLLKYGAVGGTDLVAIPHQLCDVERVITQVSTGTGPGTLKPGGTLVITWGRLFEQGDQLYVQSYVRFLKRGTQGPQRETIKVSLAGDGTELNLAVALPTQAVAFPARRISRQDLTKVSEEFRRSMVVRPEKDLNVSGESIDFAPERPFPYGVTKVEGDWMWIQPMAGGPPGWVRARISDADQPGEWSLQRWLPELAYVDAVSGFMRLRAGGGVSDPKTRTRIVAAIDAGFQRFEGAVPADDAPAVFGLARAIQGFVLWDSDATAAGRARAATLFADARASMPEYAAARNLAAVTRPLRADAAFNAKSAARIDRELIGALALDPADDVVLDNLERVYQVYAMRQEWSPFSAEEVSQRLALVKAARAKAPANN